MKTANIIALIDLQNGFVRYNIPSESGGCLYVPGAEKAIEPAANLIRHSKNKIFIWSQDFHPAEHIGFMENHSGIMALRRSQLEGQYSASELRKAALDPTILPFTNILVTKKYALYIPVAANVGGVWRKVITDSQGYITRVENEEFPESKRDNTFEQTLWRKHCIQNTYSDLFCEELLDLLPDNLRHNLRTKSPVLHGTDVNGNLHFVVRKGMRRDLDSYGIATENDGFSQTEAPAVFAKIANILKNNGITHADIDIGGLATNFCTEFSERDLRNLLVPALTRAGIQTTMRLLTDISFGIPVSNPDGSWPDLANAEARMASHGTTAHTTEDVLRASLQQASHSQNLKHSLE